MIEIKYKKSELLFAIIFGLVVIVFLSYLLIYETILVKFISAFFIILIIHIVVYVKIKQYQQFNEGTAALQIDDNGIINNTRSKTKFIAWNEISDFKTGFYKNYNLIYINPKVKKIKVNDFRTLNTWINIFTTNDDPLLYIQPEFLDIKKKDLLNLLNSKLQNYNHNH